MRRASLLWALTALFALRVAGQALAAFLGVSWLPPMERWHSGLVAYEYLLGAQLLILLLMAKISVDFTRARGWFYEPRRLLGLPLLIFGWIYLAAMAARALFIGDRPIPIVFHWVLAAFVLTLASRHRR